MARKSWRGLHRQGTAITHARACGTTLAREHDMWRWHNAGLLVGVAMLWAVESLAQAPMELDGNKLLSTCMGALRAVDYQHRDAVTMGEQGWCMGYMKGFVEG